MVSGTHPGEPTAVRIGTRGSRLALWQANHVSQALKALGAAGEIVVIKTRGDQITDRPFRQMEGKGFFTKELEEAQLAGQVDLAVHSLKDLPTVMPEGLVLAALRGRADPRDVLLARPDSVVESADLMPLRPGAVLGTSSARRQALARWLGPGELQVAELRGNVPTRVAKLRDGQYDGIVLAGAGLERLGLALDDLWVRPLPPERFVPAPGQGMLGIQCRDEPGLTALVSRLHSSLAAAAVAVERELLRRLEGGCQVPFGCFAQGEGDGFHLNLFLGGASEAPLSWSGAGRAEELVESAWSAISEYLGVAG